MMSAAAKVTPREDVIELVDFVSDDRFASSPDGRTFPLQRWSTPIADSRTFEGRRVGVLGGARWHPDGEPSFDHLEFHLDDIDVLEPGDPDPAGPRLTTLRDRRLKWVEPLPIPEL
jgi:hypothetical protein